MRQIVTDDNLKSFDSFFHRVILFLRSVGWYKVKVIRLLISSWLQKNMTERTLCVKAGEPV